MAANDELPAGPAPAPPARGPYNADIVSTLLIFLLGPPLIATILAAVLWPLIHGVMGNLAINVEAPGGRDLLPGEGLAAIPLMLAGLYYSAVLILPLLFLPVGLVYVVATRTVLAPSLLAALGCAAIAFAGLAPFAEWEFLEVRGGTLWARIAGVALFVAITVSGCWWLTQKEWGLPAVFLIPLATLVLGFVLLVLAQHVLPFAM